MSGELKKQDRYYLRSAICPGTDPFIPDSEFKNEKCELTCDVKDYKYEHWESPT